jgi:hypothetical protein
MIHGSTAASNKPRKNRNTIRCIKLFDKLVNAKIAPHMITNTLKYLLMGNFCIKYAFGICKDEFSA